MAEAIAPVIAFNEVPDQLRIPGVWIEFDARLAGQSVFAAKACIIGQRLSTGTVAAGQPVRVSANGAATDALFGRGSMLAEMVKAAKTARPWLEIWAIGLDDNPAGVAAKKKLAITGPATEAGTLNVYIGFYRVQIAVAAADTADTVAARLAAAINLLTTCPMTAAVNGTNANEVDLTCRWKGETGNDIDVRVNYYSSDKTPAGLSLTITSPVSGSGNPDITPAIDAMGDDWYSWLACAYTDGANMAKFEAELGSRFGPMRAIGGRLFTAVAGTHAAIGTFGNAHNSPHITCMGAGKSPTPPWIWAAAYMAEAGHSLGIDPARQLRGRVLQVAAPAKSDRWDNTQRNELLYDGIATSTVDADGTVRIEAEISMYQTNAGGLGDDAWLFINRPETLERIRLEQRHYFTQRYPDWKLADDDYDVPPGQPIMQPKKAVAELIFLYRTVFMPRGWCQDLEGYKQTLLAAVHPTNRDRLDVYDSPKLINNMRLLAAHTEFR